VSAQGRCLGEQRNKEGGSGKREDRRQRTEDSKRRAEGADVEIRMHLSIVFFVAGKPGNS